MKETGKSDTESKSTQTETFVYVPLHSENDTKVQITRGKSDNEDGAKAKKKSVLCYILIFSSIVFILFIFGEYTVSPRYYNKQGTYKFQQNGPIQQFSNEYTESSSEPTADRSREIFIDGDAVTEKTILSKRPLDNKEEKSEKIEGSIEKEEQERPMLKKKDK